LHFFHKQRAAGFLLLLRKPHRPTQKIAVCY